MPLYAPLQLSDEGASQGAIYKLDIVGSSVSGSVASGVGTLTVTSVTMSSTTIAFTDGDTFRRTTISDAAVTTGSKIILLVRRPNTTIANDAGYIYTANIITIANGSFDVNIACTAWGFEDPMQQPPNETITLFYLLG